jgi:hypothetical protein
MKKEGSEKSAEILQDEVEKKTLKSGKYEARYKHGGPMRTVKKKK